MTEIVYKNITLKEMLEMEVADILMNYKNGGKTYYFKNEENEFCEITKIDLLSGRFYMEDGDYSEFVWELEESHIYIKK